MLSMYSRLQLQLPGKYARVFLSSRTCTTKTEEKPLTPAEKVERGIIKSFDSIPGPKPYKYLGTWPMYWPVVGRYSWRNQKETYLKFYHEFGPIVREEFFPGVPVVHIFHPDDMRTVFRNEGMYPSRYSHLVLEKYRLSRPEVYNSGGVLPTNGPTWRHLRMNFQRNFTRPADIHPYVERVDQITEEFVVARFRPGIIEDGADIISRLFLELITLVVFDERFNAFTDAEMSPLSRSSRLMESASIINGSIMVTNIFPLYQFFPRLSLAYRRLEKAHYFVEKVALEQINKKVRFIEKIDAEERSDREPNSLLENYLRLTTVDIKDVTGMVVDLLLGGVDTVSSSTSFLLYHLARHPEVQDKLYEEACKLLPEKDSPLDVKKVEDAVYARNTIKESFRLNPVAVGVGRILPVDVELRGYHVPKGTNIVIQNQVACTLSKNFDNPDRFMPERWNKRLVVKEGTDTKEAVTKSAYHPFLVLPFSYGARTCIARRVAELNMTVFLIRMCRRNKLKWLGDSEIGIKTALVQHPDRPIRIEVTHRDK